MLVTISDKKLGVDQNSDGVIDYYTADVMSAQDYYPFGQLQPGRQYGTLGRYGFNGKEQDPETKGSGVQYDYGFRIYDARIGRFLSVDPLTRTYPWYTPYQFAGNKPIWATDVDGLEENTTSTYAKKPIMYIPPPTFNGVIAISNINAKGLHKVFEGNYAQLKKFDQLGVAPLVVDKLVGANVGTSGSKLELKQTGTRREKSVTWKGTDYNYYNQFSYTLTSNNVTETGTFEVFAGKAQVSARIWDPLTFVLLNKVISSVVSQGISVGSRTAYQSTTVESLEGSQKVYNGATLYRLGKTGVSNTGADAQYWSLENPLSMKPEEYAKKYGVDLERIKNADFLETATWKPGAKYITREAPPMPGAPKDAGGGIEAVVEKGGTTGNTITPIKR